MIIIINYNLMYKCYTKCNVFSLQTIDCGHFWGTYYDKDYVTRTAQMHKNIQDWVKRNRGALLKVAKMLMMMTVVTVMMVM